MTDSPSTPTPQPAALYVVATPIGHLDDLSARAVATLRSVPCVAAEDTRVTKTLLAHLGARPELFSAHSHNEDGAARRVLERLGAGKSVALVTDAGTPAVSDPGARVVAAAHAAGFRVVPVPGPSAVVALLSAAGFEDAGFRFVGFLPGNAKARRTLLSRLSGDPASLVFYEAPHRIDETLAALAEGLGAGREVVVGRELTKRFEEIWRGTLGESVAWLEGHADRRRGEFAIAVAGRAEVAGTDEAAAADPRLDEIEARLLAELAGAMPSSQAARIAARVLGRPRDALYRRLVELSGERGATD